MPELPKVGHELKLEYEDIAPDVPNPDNFDIQVIAVDLEECIWTCYNPDKEDIVLLRFDENGHWWIIGIGDSSSEDD